jgi:transposase
MNAVGIDVSKGKSMVAALRPMGEVALLPQEFLHTAPGLDQMAHTILALGEDTRIVMEATGRYHEPVAAALSAYGIYVCVYNSFNNRTEFQTEVPLLIIPRSSTMMQATSSP